METDLLVANKAHVTRKRHPRISGSVIQDCRLALQASFGSPVFPRLVQPTLKLRNGKTRQGVVKNATQNYQLPLCPTDCFSFFQVTFGFTVLVQLTFPATEGSYFQE